MDAGQFAICIVAGAIGGAFGCVVGMWLEPIFTKLADATYTLIKKYRSSAAD